MTASARRRRLAVVGALYLVSYIGYSFFYLALGAILLGRGVPLSTVALVNLLGVIYFGRVLIGPVIDRFCWPRLGHYRSWLILTQLALIAALVCLAPLDPVTDLSATLAIMAAVLVLSAFHDTAINGLAVRLLLPTDHGVANGIQIAASSGSILIGSGGALLLYAHTGWAMTTLALAAVFVIPLAVLAVLTEPPAEQPTHRAASWLALVSFFQRPRMAMWALVVIPVFALSDWLVSSSQSAMLLAARWSLDEIALLQSAAITVQIAAAVGTGIAIHRFGKQRTVLVIGGLGIVAVTAMLPLAGGNGSLLPTVTAVVLLSIVFGAKMTWFATVSMSQARKSSGATDYTVPMSVEGIGVTVASSAGLGLAHAVGFGWLVGGAVVIAAAGTVIAATWARGLAQPASEPAFAE
ncbi:MFS transporter [Saccharopolyspora indica]|uniref:MFS transporter n=1 Tax=Saccharopolyspora indica TaxID=1229659 RepID=UPI0022EAEFF4|nr:MFS transporter [Saccharopolyspora indica]MDA3645322.1 MFS transporter [Saccharopolyspora indica]